MFRILRRKPDPPALKSRVEQLELQLDDIKHDLTRATQQLQKLSGSYYRRFGKEPPVDSSPPPESAETKAQLRLRLGIVPGKVPPNLRS